MTPTVYDITFNYMFMSDDVKILEEGLKQMRSVCDSQKTTIAILEQDRSDLRSQNDYLKARVEELKQELLDMRDPIELDPSDACYDNM